MLTTGIQRRPKGADDGRAASNCALCPVRKATTKLIRVYLYDLDHNMISRELMTCSDRVYTQDDRAASRDESGTPFTCGTILPSDRRFIRDYSCARFRVRIPPLDRRMNVNKLPQITLAFWIMKIAATTLGETAGDLLAQTLQVGYLASSAILVGLFLISLMAQLRAKAFHPALYWTVILSTSTAGTTMSDFMNRTAGLGYTDGALVLLTGLGAVFAVWKFTGNSFDVARISTFRGELLYWVAILFSNTLGTSLGDFLADDSGLGFGGAALLISGILLFIVLAMRFTTVSKTLLFWIAFVLTRPLGASAGDFFSKPVDHGGLGYGTIGASVILGTILVSLIGYTYWQMRRNSDEGGPLTQQIKIIP
jgi:uncharacterized membrane-anchored protein